MLGGLEPRAGLPCEVVGITAKLFLRENVGDDEAASVGKSRG